MIKLRNLLESSPMARYITTGLAAFLIELSVILVFTHLGLSPIVAVAIAFWIGFSVAFLLQKLFAFRNTERRGKHLIWQTVLYGALVLINYAFTLVFVLLTESLVGVFVARTIALGVTTVWNYVLYRHVIFNPSAPNKLRSLTRRFLTYLSLRRITLALILTLPIIAYTSPVFLAGPDTIIHGDYDMQVQMTEAARISILEFKEFPFWNPWVSGGVPLYADPQFGLFTPQTLFSLVAGSALAWKLTVLVYLIVGFFSMKKLLSHVTERKPSSDTYNYLLSYVWIFGSFFALRAVGGHFTFLLLLLTPLAVYLYLNINRGRRYTIYLSLLIAYLFGAALHYSSILIVLLLLLVSLVDICFTAINSAKNKRIGKILASPALIRFSRLVIAVIGGMILVLPRIYLSLEYLRDNSVARTSIKEPFLGLSYGLNTLTQPYGSYSAPKQALFTPFEASAYIGSVTFLLFVCLLAGSLYLLVKKQHRFQDEAFKYLVIFLVVGTTAFIIGTGGKPFELLRELPVMSSMRVSTRYFILSAFAVIVSLSILLHLVGKSAASYRKIYTPLTVVFLVGAVVQVACTNFRTVISPVWTSSAVMHLPQNYTSRTSAPRSEAGWRFNEPHYFALTEATQAHHAQLIADNALVDTRVVPSARCDEDEIEFYCSFVLSKNAQVISWTPNGFTLKRTAPGVIRININEASHWTVNGAYANPEQKTVQSQSIFTISDKNDLVYTVSYRPLPRLLK